MFTMTTTTTYPDPSASAIGNAIRSSGSPSTAECHVATKRPRVVPILRPSAFARTHGGGCGGPLFDFLCISKQNSTARSAPPNLIPFGYGKQSREKQSREKQSLGVSWRANSGRKGGSEGASPLLMTMDDEAAGEGEEKKVAAALPTMEEIVGAAARQGLKLEHRAFGPSIKVVASSLDGKKVFGLVEGWITLWTKGRILHLEAARLERAASKQVGNVFGAGLFVGAMMLRFGLDRGCRTAELMAIYDDVDTHAKLVKYYSRLGFKVMYDVDGEDWKHFLDRVIWGGVGTRMDGDCEEMLRRWSPVLRPTPKTSQTSRTGQ